MKRSESEKKAQDKYNKVSVRSFTFRFNRIGDADVIERLDMTENKADYLRNLIREDRSPFKETIVKITHLKDLWKAEGYGQAAGLELKEGSYDVLLLRIADEIKKKGIEECRIITESTKIRNKDR